MSIPGTLRIKGLRVGYCSICGMYGDLTHDHVPPKGGMKMKPVEIRTLAQAYYGSPTKAIVSQNGVKFRTLCGRCNNELLGTKYDPELRNFTDQVSLFLRNLIESNIYFPPNQPFQIRTQRVVRAIVGHLLAAFLPDDTSRPQPASPAYDSLRSYFLDDNEPIPKELSIYIWLYPVKDQIIIRGFGLSSIRGSGTIVGDIIKFFPMAYWLVWEQPTTANINQIQLGARKNMGIDETEIIIIDFSKIPSRSFPESPKDDEFVLLNDQFSSSSELRRRI